MYRFTAPVLLNFAHKMNSEPDFWDMFLESFKLTVKLFKLKEFKADFLNR